ncbi:MAG TPA: dTMP kinase [Melioribacteraceae bacterium]|mgnify:CR=1 FL=1|nr:dTMP kinase [Melioribacteraceae bacterium]
MFITFEGLDFSGKSTQVQILEKYLLSKGEKVIVIREPGGTPISEKIRNILLDKNNSEMRFETEALLFAASRSQLVNETILPALEKNIFVISDRFHDSSIAYQSYGRGLSLQFVNELQNFVIKNAIPAVTFFIDIPIDEVVRRMSRVKKVELDRIESSKVDFYERVRNGYLELAAKEKRIKVLNGLLPIDELHLVIRSEIEQNRK